MQAQTPSMSPRPASEAAKPLATVTRAFRAVSSALGLAADASNLKPLLPLTTYASTSQSTCTWPPASSSSRPTHVAISVSSSCRPHGTESFQRPRVPLMPRLRPCPRNGSARERAFCVLFWFSVVSLAVTFSLFRIHVAVSGVPGAGAGQLEQPAAFSISSHTSRKITSADAEGPLSPQAPDPDASLPSVSPFPKKAPAAASDFEDDTAVDVVYTWVNGSDPAWIARRDSFRPADASEKVANLANNRDNRYVEHDELRFSLRSIVRYAPWTRNIFIVTDDQRPAWMDLPEGASEMRFAGADGRERRLRLVPHRELFEDPAALPVFNSYAIESQLHRIRGLSRRALFLNDDFFLGGPFRLGDLWRPDRGTRLLLERHLPVGKPAPPSSRSPLPDPDSEPTAAPSSPAGSPPAGSPVRPLSEWNALGNSNRMLDERFGTAQRAYVSHMPRLVDVAVLREMAATWPEATLAVSRHRFRSEHDHHTFFNAPHFLAERFAEEAARAVLLAEWDANADGRLTLAELRAAAADVERRGRQPDPTPVGYWEAAGAVARYLSDLKQAAGAGQRPAEGALQRRFRGAPWLAEPAARPPPEPLPESIPALDALAMLPRAAARGLQTLYGAQLDELTARRRWPLLDRYRTSAEMDWPPREGEPAAAEEPPQPPAADDGLSLEDDPADAWRWDGSPPSARDPRLLHTMFMTLSPATDERLLDRNMREVAKGRPTFFCVNDDRPPPPSRAETSSSSGAWEWSGFDLEARLHKWLRRLFPRPAPFERAGPTAAGGPPASAGSS